MKITIIAIMFLGLVGLFIASYIYNKKRKNKKLICPRYSDCDSVIHSGYSKLLNIPVELLGMIYYFFICFSYLSIFLFNITSKDISIVLFGISTLAFVFSVYLVLIQVFSIKHLCTWCLSSAFISFLIFVLSLINLLNL